MPGSTVTRPAAAAPVAPIARTPTEPAATPVTAGPTPPRTRPAAPKALDVERTMAVLSSVLDDLGAAHHRPFSRE